MTQITSRRSITIEETRETGAHKRSSHTARSRKRQDAREAPTVFCGVDGEGMNFPSGDHRYVLLSAGDRHVSDENGLSWEQVFEFLWENFTSRNACKIAYTGFFLGYDFCQWFRSLPENRARMLLTAEGRTKRARRQEHAPPFPVRLRLPGEEEDTWEIDILGTKRFKLRKKGADRWMYICDAGPFFQKAFLTVIDPKNWSDPVVTPEEYEILATGKARRSTAVLDDSMLRYNALENDALARVLTRLDEGLRSLGIHLKPDQWYGPGQAAAAWLKDRAITSKRLQEVTPRETLEAARASYYGGWFEIFAHGLVPGITHEYDINSAYPYIISGLPCLEHGRWISGPYNSGADNLCLVYAQIRGYDQYVGTMLHRGKNGEIYRPHQTEGWYWLNELEMAQKAGLVSAVDIRESYSYIPCDCPCPFREVRDIYALRQEVGKKTPLGIACKLVPNSLYGKFAQSVGSPKYANPVYASLITSGCRRIILDAIATHPKGTADVLMVATDGVYFRTPHPGLRITAQLGDFDHDTKENLTLFKPGVYWDDRTRRAVQAGDNPVFKARGINARDFARHIDRVDQKFKVIQANRDPEAIFWPLVRFPVQFSMITALQALQRGQWDLAGTQVHGHEVIQDSDPSLKRTGPYWDGPLLRTRPRANHPYEPSQPYAKRMGLGDPWSEESEAEQGITPLGNPLMLIREGLWG